MNAFRYRHKPIEITALQWIPADPVATGRVVGTLLGEGVNFRHPSGMGATTTLLLDTPEGEQLAEPGDWIVRADGEDWAVMSAFDFGQRYEAAAVPAPAADRAALRDRNAEQPCDGFPDACPNLRPVLPDPPHHDGGVRCACGEEQHKAGQLRAAVLEEAAAAVAADTGFHIRYGAAVDYAEHYAALLRRMAVESAAVDRVAAETPPAETERRLARVREWVTSDVVTARSGFGSGYREAQRDIRDLIDGPGPVVEAQPGGCAECSHPAAVHEEGDDPVTPGSCADCDVDDDRHDFVEAQPGKDTETPQHAPGTAVLCPDCRAKGHAVCMADKARIVGYSGKGRLWCLTCPRADGEDVPVTIDVVCFGELCAGCGRDVVDVARATEQPKEA